MKKIALLCVPFLLLLSACSFVVDPNIPYRYAELTPTAVPTEEVVSGELPPLPGEDGVDEPAPNVVPPTCDIIKGNINSKGEKIAHAPGDPNYNQVKIDESKGEKFFCTLEDAIAEGWRAVK
jgi:hypothetical protein